jgi:hypothetical protein
MQLGLTYVYLATESRLPAIRRQVVTSVEHLTTQAPKTASELVRAGLAASFARQRTSILKNQNSSEGEKPAVNKRPYLLAFLAASAAFGEGVESTLREQLLAELVVLAHHPEICESSRVHTELGRSLLSQVEILGKFGLSYARKLVWTHALFWTIDWTTS